MGVRRGQPPFSGSFVAPLLQTYESIETTNAITDQANHIEGVARRTHTFHRIDVRVFCASYQGIQPRAHSLGAFMGLTSAQVEARCMLLIVPNRMIKRQPKVRLISAHTRDMRAAVRVTGSYPISGTWNMVTIALQRRVLVQSRSI